MDLKVLLIGQPNVGKSSILNALTGAKATVSNYPGTTVDITVGRAEINGTKYVFVDTPGIYNLFPSSMEEEITEKAVIEEDYEFVINVVDATALERNLIITVALAELGIPMIIAVNFWEEAEKKGIRIDYQRLENLLGVPVVKVNPFKKGGLKELISRINEFRKPSFHVRYDDHIEEAINNLLSCVEGSKLNKRGVAARLIARALLLNIARAAESSRGWGTGRNVMEMARRFNTGFEGVTWHMLEKEKHFPVVVVRLRG